jgi:hypothetical protein
MLFKEGTHVTDVGVQYNGEIAIGSGGVGGEHYLRVPVDERQKLLSALASACEIELSESMRNDSAAETIIVLFDRLFGKADEDPYVDIQKFLTGNQIAFKGEYWPSR